MTAGAFRELVTIEKREVSTDADGFDLETWEEYYKNYSYVNKLSGTEFWTAAETASQSTIRFEFRYHKQLEAVNTKDYRILFRGKAFNITNVDNVQFKNEIVKISGIEVE